MFVHVLFSIKQHFLLPRLKKIKILGDEWEFLCYVLKSVLPFFKQIKRNEMLQNFQKFSQPLSKIQFSKKVVSKKNSFSFFFIHRILPGLYTFSTSFTYLIENIADLFCCTVCFTIFTEFQLNFTECYALGIVFSISMLRFT